MSQNVFYRLTALYESYFAHTSFLLPFLKLVHSLLKILHRDGIFLIKGQMEYNGNSITTLFIGAKEIAHRFATAAYPRSFNISYLGKILSFQVDSIQLPPADVKVVSFLSGPLAGKFLTNDSFILPYIDFNLDLNAPMYDIFKRMSGRRRGDIKRLHRYDYTYEVCRGNVESHDFFYWKMYMPHIKNRFQTGAHIRSYPQSRACYLDNGGIVFVKWKDRSVAGILFQIKRRTLYAMSIGVDQEFTKHRAGQAALLFLIKWAKERDLTTLNYGATLPFLKDGVFNYKKEWGMFVEPRSCQPFCSLEIGKTNESSLSFLANAPFIFLDKGSAKAAVFVNHIPREDELEQISSEYLLPRLDSLVVVAYGSISMDNLDESEANVSTDNTPEVTPKPIMNFCSILRKSGYEVQIFERIRTSEEDSSDAPWLTYRSSPF